jgi:hypothetical protein
LLQKKGWIHELLSFLIRSVAFLFPCFAMAFPLFILSLTLLLYEEEKCSRFVSSPRHSRKAKASCGATLKQGNDSSVTTELLVPQGIDGP